jgi:hypothetical protein
MATTKLAPDVTLDKMLDYISTATQMIVCSGSSSPTNGAGALSAALASSSMSSGDFAKADDATGALGRKVTVAAKTSLSVSASGDATCVALLDSSNVLLYVTTCTTQTLTSGNTVNVPSWKVQIGDPT